MSAGNGYPICINNLFVRELNCDGSIKPLAEGGCSFWFPGSDSMQVDAGLTTETIAAIASECYNRDADERISGADAILNLGCGFLYPEWNAVFVNGYHESAGLGGDIQVSFDKPGEDSCKDCSKTTGKECPPEFAIIVDYCVVDCNDDVIGREFMVIRRISKATIANRKRIGGNNVDSFRADITLQIGTNDGFGYGPGDLLVSDDTNGDPECASVTCGIDCPAELDLSALDALCGCAAEAAGCKITPELLVEFPELDIPLLTL